MLPPTSGEERNSVCDAGTPENLLDTALLEYDGLSHLPPITSYDLSQDEHRREFLFHYYWVGEAALFAAVSHVWNSLEEPRHVQCTTMGLLSGTGGIGKTGLVLMLQQFLREALASIEPIPPRDDFDSFDRWSEVALSTFTDDEQRVRALCARYSAILDQTPTAGGAKQSGKILTGPWKIRAAPAVEQPSGSKRATRASQRSRPAARPEA